MEGFSPLLIIPALILMAFLGLYSIHWRQRRASEILEEWARDEDLEVLEQEYRWVRRGPFWWRASSEGHAVLRITVRDRTGRTRRGWLRCGSWFTGLFSSTARAEWDDE